MIEWKALVGRISLFPPQSSPPPSALDVFRNVWGVDPNSFKKQANPLLPTVAQGKQGGILTDCSVNPGRIELNLKPAPPNDRIDSSFPLIEDTSELYAELTRIINAIAAGQIATAVSRMALIVQFVTLCANTIEANNILTSIMPDQYRMRITDEEDFIFQVNQTYMSRKIERIKMNSLRKWSLERFQVLTFRIPTGGAPTPTLTIDTTNLTTNFIAASLMLESNNVPVSNLKVEEQSYLLQEALSGIAETQRDFGLNIKGFEK